MSVGFIGIGNMGFHMARHLLATHPALLIFDTNQKAVNSVEKLGARVADSPADLASRCTEVVTMLPTKNEVREVLCGPDGMLKTMSRGTLCIDCSTVDLAFVKEMSDLCKSKVAEFIDAPVSGGVIGAQQKSLTFMVGGDSLSYLRAIRVLESMGKYIIHCGDVGSGQIAKLCNNMLFAIQMVGLSETLNLGERLGMNSKMLSEIINCSSARCFASETYNPVPGVDDNTPASNKYERGFKTELVAKDLGLIQDAATSSGSPTPLGSLTHQIFRLLANSPDYKCLDFSSVYQFLKNAD